MIHFEVLIAESCCHKESNEQAENILERIAESRALHPQRDYCNSIIPDIKLYKYLKCFALSWNNVVSVFAGW